MQKIELELDEQTLERAKQLAELCHTNQEVHEVARETGERGRSRPA